MIIENKKVVSLNYHLTIKDKEKKEDILVEKTSKTEPFVFLFGTGGLLQAFENNLKGKKAGDSFDFIIDFKNAYGIHDKNHIINVPIHAFKAEDGTIDTNTVKIGNALPMVDNEGHSLQGIVEDITGEYVRMDFNHPLAGEDLHFVGEVLEIKDATAEEIAHGHVHGHGGHHH